MLKTLIMLALVCVLTTLMIADFIIVIPHVRLETFWYPAWYTENDGKGTG